MEFLALGLIAAFLGLRGARSGRRTYLWSAACAVVAAIYTYYSF